ncbi:hypothetical protein M569_11123, partial [Genlisea aurea]
AYASLLSLNRVVDRLQQLHLQGKICLDSFEVGNLRERLQSLIGFFETRPSSKNRSLEADSLCFQLSLFAREAHIIIGEQIVNQLRGDAGSGFASFNEVLLEVIRKIESMEVSLRLNQSSIEKIDYTERRKSPAVEHSGEKLVESSDPNSFSSTAELVAFENRVTWVVYKLTDNETSLQVIPIVGMGGIGKTNLALTVYDLPNVQGRFDRRLWCVISQEYDVKQIIKGLLGDETDDGIAELGKRLYQKLYRRRYLIVMDDVWSITSWEGLRPHLPDNQNGSRIIITTRISTLADSLTTCAKSCALALLDGNTSWDLLRKKIFGESGSCSDELQEIGKEIAKSCRGLPLSLVAVAGLLAKSDMT